jgi:putative transposase
MLTRRIVLRTHLLRPDRALNDLFFYCIAVIAQKFGIVVHAVNVMSDHYHIVLTDTLGNLPNFARELHRLLALGIQCLRRWDGAVWDHNKTSMVELRTPQAVLQQMAYCIANPVAAELVQRAHQWPGVTVSADELGRASRTVKRPAFFFDPENPRWPDTATLTFPMPQNLQMTHAQAREIVAAEVEQTERKVQIDLRSRGKKVLGRDRVCAMSPYTQTRTPEPKHERNPTFAVGRQQPEALAEAVAVVRAFRSAYRAALEQWRSGIRDVLFPAGTWLMRWLHAANVAAA